MHEKAILKIIKYLEEDVFEPKANWSKRKFQEQSYARHTINEIVELLMCTPFKSADMVVEDYLFNMVLFSCMAKTERSKLIFSTARYVAEDILLIIT